MTKKIKLKKMERQQGIVLVVALLLMAIMSIIGATAITTSRIDIQISHNTRSARQAFYYSDGGIEMSPKFVRAMIEKGAGLTSSDVPNVNFDDGLFDEIMGFATEADSNDQVYPTVSNPDLNQTMGDLSVNVDVDRSGTGFMGGSGVEFASGAEGAGAGSTGGILIFYHFDTVGTAPGNTLAHVDVKYRYVVGTAGGK